MEVLVFRTSVETREDVRQLTPILNGLAGRGRWNFALDDCDRILRIASGSVRPEFAIEVITNHGFLCTELEDEVPA